jgi:hypothetical protein
MSFGSGTKEIWLYTSWYWYAGKCRFGEFPIKIVGWNLYNRIIYIQIALTNSANMPYIIQYTESNRYLGNFKIEYEIKETYRGEYRRE